MVIGVFRATNVRRALSLVAINVLVFLVAAEVLALAVFYYQHGWLYYIDPNIPPFAAPAESRDETTLAAVGLHPYFGPIHRPGIPFDIPPEQRAPGDSSPPDKTNNIGFVSPHDYPYARRSADEYIVGIFGGSVAAWFCELGVARLVGDLSEQPALRGRSIVPLCFAHEGYKQPQQLLVLSYFLSIGQTFDAVVNIDGFNEVALSPINEERGFDASMPSAAHMEPLINLINQATLTRDKIESLTTILRLRDRLAALAARLNATRFAAVFVVLERIYRATEQEYQAERVRFDALPSNPPSSSVIHVTPARRDGEGLMARVADNWATSSAMMQSLLASRGVKYLHVLQANQYFTSRRFSEAEARVALAQDSPFKASVERGYPLLVKAVQSGALGHAGVNVLDATHLFDNEPAAVYVDNCCHYTRRGNEILADAIARAVIAGYQR